MGITLHIEKKGQWEQLMYAGPINEDTEVHLTPMITQLGLCRRLLGRPASESGRLCHGDGGHEGGDRRRRALMLASMKRLAVSSRRCRSLMLGSYRHC